MRQFICDRCGKAIEDNGRRHVSYTGGNEADLCMVLASTLDFTEGDAE